VKVLLTQLYNNYNCDNLYSALFQPKLLKSDFPLRLLNKSEILIYKYTRSLKLVMDTKTDKYSIFFKLHEIQMSNISKLQNISKINTC